jgi:ATP-dependent DNA helicase RecQ
MNAETDGLEEAYNDESLMDYSEEEIRLIRIKFISEHAN